MTPLVAPVGTVALSWVAETNVVAAAVPWNFAFELLLKPTPVIVTEVVGVPLDGVEPVMDSVTVYEVALVTVPPAEVSEIVAVVAPLGTFAEICEADTMVCAALRAPNLTVVTAS